MDKLNEIVMKIMECYQSNLENDDMYKKVSELWTEYYQISNKLGKKIDFAYQLYLMCENECYSIYQKPIIKNIDEYKLNLAINHLREALKKNYNGIVDGISYDEVYCILDFVVTSVRKRFEILGVDIENNSLNGFCELGQALSIMPFENMGLEVTKNKASDVFGYHLNHAFGTVKFPIKENGILMEDTFLIDTTYRQFFSSVRCNEGRYYTKEENTGKIANPDPGYFVDDINFAKNLMANGYVRLDLKTAYLYGHSFYLSSLNKEDLKIKKNRNYDYYSAILDNSSDYCVSYDELEGLEFDFPDSNYRKVR